MEKKYKILSIVITIVLLVTVLFSYVYIVEYTNHNCVGDDCLICMEIEAAMQMISSVKIMPSMASVLVILCVFTHICTIIKDSDCTKSTLITLKVEFLN